MQHSRRVPPPRQSAIFASATPQIAVLWDLARADPPHPNLGRVRSRGLTFQRFFTPPHCVPWNARCAFCSQVGTSSDGEPALS